METLSIVAPPASPVVPLDDMKGHLRVELDFTEDDALILGYTAAAVGLAEKRTKGAFINRSYRWTIDGFPGSLSSALRYAYGSFAAERIEASAYPWAQSNVLSLPRPPLVSVESITYLDLLGEEQTLDPARYRVLPGTPGRIALARNAAWPMALDAPGSVAIEYTAGYGNEPADVPAAVVAAIKLLVGSWYRNREAVTPGAMVELPLGVTSLLNSAGWGFYG